MSTPNVIVSLEPEENGNLVYLAAVPLWDGLPPQPYLNFRARIKNNGSTVITLERIIVVLFTQTGSSITPHNYSFERSISIEPGFVGQTYISKDEAIPLPDVADISYKILLYFSGHDEPIVQSGAATSHNSPTSQGSYRFYGNTDDMRMHEYFIPKRHTEVGYQFFGYDVVVQKWVDNDGFTSQEPGTSGENNEDYFGFGKPLYAMADGNIIGFANDIDNNPPGMRSLMFIDDDEAGHVSGISLVRLSDEMMAVAVRTAHSTLKIIIYQLDTPGVDVVNSELVRLGETEAEEVISNVVAIAHKDFAADSEPKWLITVVRLAEGELKVILWEISADYMSITRISDDEAGIINQLTAVSLTPTRFTVAVITATGRLKIIVWDIVEETDTSGMVITGHILVRRGDFTDEAIVRLDVAKLYNQRFITAVQTKSNQLKLIAWNLGADGVPVRLKDATADGTITDVSAAWINGPADGPSFGYTIRIATAVRTSSNRLKITYWDYHQNSGDIEVFRVNYVGFADAVKITHLAAGFDDAATCIITPEGKLQLSMWKYDDENDHYFLYAQNDGGPVDLIDLIWLQDDTPYWFITAVRTDQQTLKIIAWFLGSGGGNHVAILHGDEIVYMAHLAKGSVNPALLQDGAPVTRGQYLGQLGNSGNSGGPHLHIHVSKAEPGKSLAQLIEDKKNMALVQTFRPIPFHNAQAMVKDLVVPGPGVINNNLFSVVEGNGFYWDQMAVWPGTTTPGIPTGRPGLTRWGVPSTEFQETFDAVTGANYYPIWIDGYNAGTHIRFNMLFRPEPAPLWSAEAGLTSQEYDDLVEERKQDGFRPVYVNSFKIGSHVRYSVIFRKNDGVAWSAYHERSASEHQLLLDELIERDFVPVNVSVVSVNGQLSYTALFERRDVGRFRSRSFLTTDEFQQEFDEQDEKGLQVEYIDAYIHNDSVRYSAIWNEEHSGTDARVRHHLTEPQLQQEYDAAVRDGFVTAVLAGYSAGGQSHFAVVWRKS